MSNETPHLPGFGPEDFDRQPVEQPAPAEKSQQKIRSLFLDSDALPIDELHNRTQSLLNDELDKVTDITSVSDALTDYKTATETWLKNRYEAAIAPLNEANQTLATLANQALYDVFAIQNENPESSVHDIQETALNLLHIKEQTIEDVIRYINSKCEEGVADIVIASLYPEFVENLLTPEDAALVANGRPEIELEIRKANEEKTYNYVLKQAEEYLKKNDEHGTPHFLHQNKDHAYKYINEYSFDPKTRSLLVNALDEKCNQLLLDYGEKQYSVDFPKSAKEMIKEWTTDKDVASIICQALDADVIATTKRLYNEGRPAEALLCANLAYSDRVSEKLKTSFHLETSKKATFDALRKIIEDKKPKE